MWLVNSRRRKLLKTGAAYLISPVATSLIFPKAAIVRPSRAQIVQFSGAPQPQAMLDGSALAPAPSERPQLPNLLDAYHLVGLPGGRNKNNGRQPPWNVAGVDYRVGINMGVTLKNPASDTLPPNCTRDAGNQLFLVNGDTTLDGWNFANWTVLVEGGTNVKITNNNFTRGYLRWSADGGASGGIIRYNTFYAENANTGVCQFIIYRPGTYIVEYNHFDKSYHMLFQITNGDPGQSLVFRYNLLTNAGGGAPFGAHGDWIQMFGDYNVLSVHISYNTILQNIFGYATQGFSLNALNPTIHVGGITNNTMIVKTNTNCGIYLVPHWHIDPFYIRDNYVDPTYSGFRFSVLDYGWPGPYPGNVIVKTGNINMLTGGRIQ